MTTPTQKTVELVLAALYGSGEHVKETFMVEADKDYSALTEPVTVTFTPLPESKIIANKLQYIDNDIERKRAAFAADMERLEKRRAELLAIEYHPTEDSHR